MYISTGDGRTTRPVIISNHEKNLSARNSFEKIEKNRMRDNYVAIHGFRDENDLLIHLGEYVGRETLRCESFTDLNGEGKIDYMEINEENNSMIASKPSDINENTTLLEISEFTLFGYVSGLVPFPNHNQSSRNIYQCAMGKQAIGHIATIVKKRFDSFIFQLIYTQRPVAASKTLDIVKYNQIPSGLNAVVAVMIYSGYVIEDAVILNQGSIDRGLARVEVYKSNTVVIKKHSNGHSEKLVEDGIIVAGKHVLDGTVLVNKISPMTNKLT